MAQEKTHPDESASAPRYGALGKSVSCRGTTRGVSVTVFSVEKSGRPIVSSSRVCLFAIFWMAKLVKFHFPSICAGISRRISEIDHGPNLGPLTRWVTCLHLKWTISTSDNGLESSKYGSAYYGFRKVVYK